MFRARVRSDVTSYVAHKLCLAYKAINHSDEIFKVDSSL